MVVAECLGSCACVEQNGTGSSFAVHFDLFSLSNFLMFWQFAFALDHIYALNL